MSADTVGNIYGVTGRTVLNWERQGIIRAAVRVGRVIRFDVKEVELQLEAASCKNPTAQDAGQVKGAPQMVSSLLKPQNAQNSQPEGLSAP